jgi:arylsulfatase A-like enzyme
VIGNGLLQPILRPADTRSTPGAFTFLDPEASSVGFVAWGRGIRPRLRIPNLELVDVAPTIASLLGLRLDDDVDGEALIGILRASVEPPPPGPKRLGVDNEGDVERALRELGGGHDLGRDQ